MPLESQVEHNYTKKCCYGRKHFDCLPLQAHISIPSYVEFFNTSIVKIHIFPFLHVFRISKATGVHLFLLFCPLGVTKPRKKKNFLSFQLFSYFLTFNILLLCFSYFFLLQLECHNPRVFKSTVTFKTAPTHQPPGFALTVLNTLCGLFPPVDIDSGHVG